MERKNLGTPPEDGKEPARRRIGWSRRFLQLGLALALAGLSMGLILLHWVSKR